MKFTDTKSSSLGKEWAFSKTFHPTYKM